MNNKQLASQIIDLVSECMDNDCREEAAALLKVAKSLVNKERKKMTGKKPVAAKPRKTSAISSDDYHQGCHSNYGGSCH